MECFFVFGVGVDYSPTDKNYEKSQHILRVHHLKTKKHHQSFSIFGSLFPSLLLFSFSFVGLGEDPSKVEARKNDHQGNLGSLNLFLLVTEKEAIHFQDLLRERKGGLQLIDIQREYDRSESILEMKERKA